MSANTKPAPGTALAFGSPSARLLFAALAFFALVATSLTPTTARAGVERDLIAGLAGAAEPVLNDKAISASTRTQELRTVLRSAFDKNQMAQSMLGRYWRQADASQRAELVGLLETYLIDAYAGRMNSIDGTVHFQIDGERQIGPRTIVDSQVLRPNAPPVAVAWQVETISGNAVVTDITVEGVSLVVSQRADFASIIRSQGGLDGLIRLLKQKVGG